ncbi:MAG TPA: metal/formaldehyde-sensitive transcriptional repressor [Roseateles sp.]|uniref:metal/formaldehyde-sensitive transcriptional repressor n=1 Tax=Roseateles sp. TaxID=1971397 RepID=UPI002EDA1CCB
MAHVARDAKALTARIRRIKGQLGSLEEALNGDADCVAVLQQIAAVRGAVNGLMAKVLEDHLREHFAPVEGTDADEMEQLVGIIGSYLK